MKFIFKPTHKLAKNYRNDMFWFPSGMVLQSIGDGYYKDKWDNRFYIPVGYIQEIEEGDKA